MSEQSGGKPLSLDDIAPYPKRVEDATAEVMATHFAALAQLHFHLGHNDPNQRNAEESFRAFVSFYALAFLFRAIEATGLHVADRVARALWESWEHPHTLGPDVWAWLEEYGIDPEKVNAISAGMRIDPTPTP